MISAEDPGFAEEKVDPSLPFNLDTGFFWA